jgi:hypothetical protein
MYNGVTYSIAPNNPTSYSFSPIILSSQLGIHTISVKVKSIAGNILDGHNFEINISENPRPIIVNTSVSPALYGSVFVPGNLPVDFEFIVNNNGASMSGAGYRVDWSLFRSGVIIDLESDSFPTSSPSGSLSPTGFNYPRYSFDPGAIDGILVGQYVVRARLINFAAEVVAEQQWSVAVEHPALPKITARNIYSNSSSPAFDTLTKAFNGVPYTSAPSYNFIPCSLSGGVCTPVAASQGDYCVTLANAEGTYSGDGNFVRVDYYLNGGSNIYTGYTSLAAGGNKVCLSDGGASVLNMVLFNNTTSTNTQAHTLVARVVDQATGREYTTTDMNPSLGSYPVTWNFRVQPQNQAPTVSFGTMSTITCSSTSGNTRSGCTVASDTNFIVNINLDTDDFYTLPANEANFDYSIRLYENGVNIQTCSKSSAGYTGLTDVNGADGYSCVFNINSYNATGPINTMARTYQIQAEILDNGSPVSATVATSSTLNWNLSAGSVTETNTVPVITDWSVAAIVDEGQTLTMSANITDAERDNHTYIVQYCLDGPACTSTGILTSGTITRTDNTNPYFLLINHVLPEDFLHTFTLLGCHQLKRNQTCPISFRLRVTDVPFTANPLTSTSATVSSTIRNINPTPILLPSSMIPNPLAFSGSAFVGFPFSIDTTSSNFITDASTVNSEKTFRYQWYAKNITNVETYQPIHGATGRNIIWTPSLIKAANLITDNPVSLMICVDDQPAAAVPIPDLIDSVCTNGDPWNITVNNNVSVAHDLSAAPSSTSLATALAHEGKEIAIWYETPSTFNTVTSSAAYIAMIGNDKRIHVKKVLVKNNGEIDTIDPLLIVSFDAVPTGTVGSVRDLSITGTSSELYIAYLASRTGNPSSFYPQVRRIDLTATAGKPIPNIHAGKFGFDYDGLGFNNNCSPASECTTSAASGVQQISFSPTATITGNFVLATPNGNFTITFGASNGIDMICGNCDAENMALQTAVIINTSTDPLLAGYTASSSLGDLTIFGSRANDYFDSSQSSEARVADRLGNIYINGGRWHLPFINSSLGGGYNDKLSFWYSNTGDHMMSGIPDLAEPSITHPGLVAMDAAIKFDNFLVGPNLYIVMISKTGSAGKLYKVNPTTYAVAQTTLIMDSEALLDVQVAASTTNVFVGTKTSALNKYKLGIYDINPNKLVEFEIDDTFHTDSSSNTEDYFNSTNIASYRIIPYGQEARIVASSNNDGGSLHQLYMARLREVSSTWTLSCGDCQQISKLGSVVSPYTTIGVAPIRTKVANDSYRLASDGSVNGQGIKDVAFISYGDVAGNPVIGVLNVEGEAIGSSSIYTGSSPNEDAGLYRPPLVKN